MFVKTLVSEPRLSTAISVAPSSQHSEAGLGLGLERYWPDRLFSWYG